MNKPNIAIYISSFFPIVGGAERQAQNLARIIKQKGFDVIVVTRNHPKAPPFEIIDDVPVYRLFGTGPKPIKLILLFISSFLFFLKNRNKIDIIHIFQLDSHAFFASIINIFLSKKLMVKMANLGEWGEMYRLKGPVGSLEKILFKNSISLFTGTCRDVVNEVMSNGIPSEKVKIIPTGVDTTQYIPAANNKFVIREKLKLPADKNIVIFTGRLTKQKGVDILLHAWKLVEAKLDNTILLIAGQGLENKNLRELEKQLELKKVHFLGLIKDVLSYLQASDMFVFPSRADGLSNSFLEAMSTGLVPVATNYGGARDVIEENKNGFLIEIDDSKTLAEKIIFYFQNADRYTMSKNARNTVVNYCSFESVANKYIDEYNKLIS